MSRFVSAVWIALCLFHEIQMAFGVGGPPTQLDKMLEEKATEEGERKT